MGAVISASHNPMPYNGIKFFARGGFKLPDREGRRHRGRARPGLGPPPVPACRASHDQTTATNLYIDHLVPPSLR